MSVVDTNAGKILDGGPIYRSSPTIADIDTGVAGKEIAIGGNDGWLYVYHKDGSLAWKKYILEGLGSCSVPNGDGLIHSAPAVGAIFGGSTPYVVVSYGTIFPSDCDGGVVAFNGATGAIRWRFSLRAWQLSEGYPPEILYGIVSSPALADTDADGQMEIAFGGFDRNAYLLDADGGVRWYYHAADTIWSSPAFANVDTDTDLEVVFTTDISANPSMKPPTFNGGFVYAFDTHPRDPKRLGFNRGWLLKSINFDMVLYSSPAIADLDGDGVTEVIIGSGCYAPFNAAVNGHWVKILDGRTLGVIRTLNANGCVTSSPTIADLEGDGMLDIVAAVDGYHNNPQTDGLVQAWEYDQPSPKWSVAPRSAINGSNMKEFGLFLNSPVVADIDGNGSLEVLIASNVGEVTVLRGTNGQQLTCNNCGNAPTITLSTWYPVASTPAVGDIDGDNDLEVVIGGSHIDRMDRGLLYVWTNFAGQLGSAPGSLAPYSAPWPMFRLNPAHTGLFLSPALRTSMTEIALLVEPGASAQTFAVELKDITGGAINWTASENRPWISLGDTSGTTPDTLNVTVNPSSLPLGLHTGSVSLNTSLNDPTIDVMVRVVNQVYTVYLPGAQR
jgi:outer membrane protein assembly factor BamB